MIDFAHISPTKFLYLTEGRPFYLTLAHLVETDEEYTTFHIEQKKKYNSTIIMDCSAFEMFKQGRPMYPSDKLIAMGKRIDANYIVMSDYPGEEGIRTINAAKTLAPQFKDAGFGTFFVPQSRINDLDDVIRGFEWAAHNPNLVDYIGISILTAPNAYGVEKDNKLQRFVARLNLLYRLESRGILVDILHNKQKIHMLGMVDGPNEVLYTESFHKYINTWDSSAAVWAGLNGIDFDTSPTGLINGKFEKEVDFNLRKKEVDLNNIQRALRNMEYIDQLCAGGTI